MRNERRKKKKNETVFKRVKKKIKLIKKIHLL